QHVLGEVARVYPIDRAVGQRAEMAERIGLDAFEPALSALLDHARVEIDAVRADALVAHETQEDATATAEIDDAFAAREELGERLRLPADHRLVATEARLEVDGVEIRRDEVFVPELELAQALLEAGRRAVAQIEERACHELVHAFLPLGDRGQPPTKKPDERASRDRDHRADVPLAALRVICDVLIEDLGERLERILQLLAEDRPPTRQRERERGVQVRAVLAALALLADARADFGEDRVEVDGLLLGHSRVAINGYGSFDPALRRADARSVGVSRRRQCTASSLGASPETRSGDASLAPARLSSCPPYGRSPWPISLRLSTLPYLGAAVNAARYSNSQRCGRPAMPTSR